MRSPTRRPACSRGWPRRPRSAGSRRSRCWRCSSIRCCGSAPAPARMRARSRRSNARCCAGRGRSPAPRASRTRSRPSATNRAGTLHRSRSAHALIDGELRRAPPISSRRSRAALAPLEACGQARAAACATLAAAPSRRCRAIARGAGSAPSPATTARSSRDAFDEIADSEPPPTRRRAAGLCRAVRAAIADRMVRAAASGRACACASSARSKRGCSTSTAWCSAAWSKASGRRRRAPIPGSAGRCGTQLGLDLPERRIGLSAHDFAQVLGAREVILTRAAKLGGAPTVASRFMQRLAAVAGEARWKAALRARRALSRAGRARSTRPTSAAAARAPAPTPPLAARPTRLSVTEIEHWLRDPYTIYARHILRLAAARRGRHAARRARPRHRHPRRDRRLHRAIYATALPADPVGELIALGERAFRRRCEDFPEARAFWWPRFQRIARWFAGWETERRASARRAARRDRRRSSRSRSATRSFKLRARADRIERLRDGRYAILDYKTGAAPTEKQVRTGPVAAAHARSRDPARRRLRGDRRRRLGRASSSMSRCAAASRPGERSADRIQGRHAPTRRPTRRWRGSTALVDALRRRGDALSSRWCIRCGRRATATTTIWRA